MFRKILFPIDLSELSRKGLTWTAVNIVDPSSEILLVHVVEPMTGLDISPMITDAEGALEKIGAELSALGVRHRVLVLSGAPLETLSDIAHSEGCSVSVLFAEADDVVVPLIRYMAIPHLVIKTRGSHTPPPDPFRQIAVCSDLSPDRTECMLAELKALLRGRPVPMTILHAVTLEDSSSSSEMFQIASSALEEVRETVASWNPETGAELLTGEPEVEILKRTSEILPGILAVGLSTRGNLWELIVGSTGEAIIEKALCPVLVIPA